jgi:hypothetical protein
MSRKIYNRLSFMAVSWLDESTLLGRSSGYEFMGHLHDNAQSFFAVQESRSGKRLYSQIDVVIVQ